MVLTEVFHSDVVDLHNHITSLQTSCRRGTPWNDIIDHDTPGITWNIEFSSKRFIQFLNFQGHQDIVR